MTTKAQVQDIFSEAYEELTGEAFAGNIERRHHLADACAAFEDISVLLKAEEILIDVLDLDLESLDEETEEGT